MGNAEITEPWLERLSDEECLSLLRANEVGRIAVVHDGRPLIIPINYRLIEVSDVVVLAIHTRPSNVIDLADDAVAFEVDGIDPSHQRGWSVLVQGSLRHDREELGPLEPHAESESWIPEGRTTRLTIVPARISGRRLVAATLRWAFHQSAYL
jgi:nitroimidazol reductase NimA-like FMN-containing flavoprotein (pyridoxamine 5'-phosphate oxidase superfamily)